jgi:zinc protease
MIIRKGQMLLLASALVVSTGLAGAQQSPPPNPVQSAPLSQVVPTDEQITRGQLPNGLRYYVRANVKPEKRAELRLVVKAGSILEEDDQQGLAHFVEHMAFNGTEHFPKQGVEQFLESLGMRFGADINASTSFDETIFTLQVPTDKPETMDRSLLILEDWAHNVSFDQAAIDKERGVVTEEWRLRLGAGARSLDKLLPVLLKGSRYAERIPIGKPEVIQGFKPERLKKFYADWYRPDLMAVVAVGDFDSREVEKLIKTHFGGMPKSASPRPRPTYDVPDHAGTVYAITTDKETTSTSVEVENLLPARKQGTIGVYRQEIVDQLFSDMLSSRLSEMSLKPDAPFMRAGAGRGQFIGRSKDEASLSALVKDDGIDRGLAALLGEADRVARFGFTATELDRAKQMMMRARERLLVETANRVSASRADEYVRNFIEDEPLPTGQYEFALNQRFLPEITLDEVNGLAKEWFTDRNRLVVVNAPEKAGVAAPDEAKLASIVNAGGGKALTPYVDTVGATVLLESPPPPAPNAIVGTSTKDAAGITEWQLANGVKVVLKPTTFKEDEIVFRATSPGGTSLASDQDYIPASTATQVVNAGGVGAFSSVELRKVLAGKIASANPLIGELEEGMSGGSSRKDLETMFQLIYLRFTQPRADPAMFGVMTSQMKTIVANQTVSPEFAFIQMLTSTLSQNHPRRRLPTAASIDQWNLDKSMAFYKDRFADASDFTFVFVGSFDLPAMKPLVERYLGALPSIHRKETWKDVGVRSPTGVIEKTVEKGIEPKSETAIVFSGSFEYDQMHRVAIRAMAEILQSRLLTTIREELGGTYSISANASTQRNPRPEYTVGIQFGSDPQRTAALNERIMQEIEKFKAVGPSEKQVSDEREALLRDFETNSKQNGYLLGQLAARYDVGEDPAGLWNMPEYYKKIDAAMIQDAAKKYLDMNNRVRVTLVPEKK